MFSKVVAALVLTICVASCSAVGPDYKRPVIALENQYALGPGNTLREAAHDAWWTTLSDPVLDRLMQRALVQNLDVQSSVARIRQAQAQLRGTGVPTQLSGDLEASARGQWIDGDYGDSAQLQATPVFVLDLFGENQRRQEGAQAALDRAVFEEAASRLALQQALVSSYFDLRYFQELERLRGRAISNQKRVVGAVRQRLALAEETRMTLRRAEGELQLQQALVPQSRQGQVAAILRIATLLAEPFDPLRYELQRGTSVPRPAQNILPGVPVGLLKNRPDVRAAEARLRAAVAQAGVTEAQLYPTLRLNGALTASSGVNTVSLGPSLSVPLFDRVQRIAGRDAALAAAQEAELDWRATVFESVEDVQLNLSQLQTSDKEVKALSAAVSKFREAARLSRDAFQLQAITHLEILDMEDSLTETELRLINAHRSYAAAWARLNVAIGQGWQAYADSPALAK